MFPNEKVSSLSFLTTICLSFLKPLKRKTVKDNNSIFQTFTTYADPKENVISKAFLNK